MTPVSRRVIRGAAIFVACLAPAVSAEILEYRAAFASTTPAGAPATATFTSVEAVAAADLALPARAFAGGFFTNQFQFGPLPPLGNQAGTDGVLVGLTLDPAANSWGVDFLLQAPSDGGNARINDVAISPNGEIVVVGTFQGDVTFDLQPPGNAVTFTTAPLAPPEGFVARSDPFGNWIEAFQVSGMQPNSIALDGAGDIYLTGPGTLVRKYDGMGTELWDEPVRPQTLTLRHVAASRDITSGFVYVTGTLDSDGGGGNPNEEVFLAQLDPVTGDVNWTALINSAGEEHAGGLGIGPLGNVRLSFSSDAQVINYNADPLVNMPPNPGRHAFLLFVRPDGSLQRDFLLAPSRNAGDVMETTDLSIDPNGTAYVAVSFNGEFLFEEIPRFGQGDAAVIAVDPAGVLFRFSDSNGQPQAFANAVAAPERNQQILVGGFNGPGDEEFGGIPLPGQGDERAFFASLEPTPNQQPYIIFDDVGLPVPQIEGEVAQLGGEVFRTVVSQAQGGFEFVAAFLTPEQLASLRPPLRAEPDLELVTDGTVLSSGWALAHLNAATSGGNGPPFNFTYPEPCNDTVLYLIDTAIDNTSGFFDGNPNLTLGASTLVRSVGDPLVSTKFDHGTTMLSMIAGPTYGVAQGTPIEVINYDIYPDGVTARLSALVEAIDLANCHKSDNHPYDPAVYCIASSATSTSVTSTTLKPAVDYAVGSNVFATIVLSAGNTTGDAADYTPSYLGADAGVICAGAIDINNAQVANTRGGSAVDVWAPGDGVLAADTSGSGITVTGTSASTAFTTGAALIYLSANPFAEPGDAETALVTTFSQSDTIGKIVKVDANGTPWFSSFADFGDWNLLTDKTATGNDDGDAWTNAEEFVWGFDPQVFDTTGSIVTLSYNSTTNVLTFEFPLACYLYEPAVLTTHTLRDGSSLVIERSVDLINWSDITNTLTFTEVGHSGGQVAVSFDYTVSSSPCFFRVHVQ